jgi:hypothetical protein
MIELHTLTTFYKHAQIFARSRVTTILLKKFSQLLYSSSLFLLRLSLLLSSIWATTHLSWIIFHFRRRKRLPLEFVRLLSKLKLLLLILTSVNSSSISYSQSFKMKVTPFRLISRCSFKSQLMLWKYFIKFKAIALAFNLVFLNSLEMLSWNLAQAESNIVSMG